MNNISSPIDGNLVFVVSENCIFQYNGNNWSKYWKSDGNIANNNDFIGTTNNQDLKFNSNDSLRMIIKNDGNIGINIEEPEFFFHVNSNDTIVENSILNATASTNTGNNVENIIDGNPNSFWQSETLYLPNSGDYSYWIKLTLDTARIINRYRLETPSNPPIDWFFQGSNDDINWVDLHEVGDFTLNNWTVRDYTLNSQTTAYQYYRLFIITIQEYLSASGWVQSDGYVRMGEFRLFEKNEYEGDFIVDSLGRVGIGTNPSEKLEVSGNILATGSITPDYVFEKYYNGESILKPEYTFEKLEKIEQFIKKHKHLPGVPSAKEIQKQGGIIVNRATEINLEKIEELYLHIFELNKRIEILEKESDRLRNSNSKH